MRAIELEVASLEEEHGKLGREVITIIAYRSFHSLTLYFIAEWTETLEKKPKRQ